MEQQSLEQSCHLQVEADKKEHTASSHCGLEIADEPVLMDGEDSEDEIDDNGIETAIDEAADALEEEGLESLAATLNAKPLSTSLEISVSDLDGNIVGQ